MAANKEEGIADEVLVQLLTGRDPATVFATGGLIDELKKRLAERMLNAEMEHHLSTETEEEAGPAQGFRLRIVHSLESVECQKRRPDRP